MLHTWYERLRGPLSEGDDPQRVDLIFVLAGHRSRKVHAARLFTEGWAPRLLMSTVNPTYVARVLEREAPELVRQDTPAANAIRDAASRPYPDASEQQVSFACLDENGWSVQPIPATSLGTLTEIKAFARWLRERPAVRSVLVVSSGMHLRRLRMCCRHLVSGDRSLRFLAVPKEAADGTALGGHAPPEGAKEIALEYTKLALYRMLFALRLSGDG